MTISLKLSNEEAALMKNYAQMRGITLSELVRKCVLERIEDEYSLSTFNVAMAEYREDPETFTLDEVEMGLGFK